MVSVGSELVPFGGSEVVGSGFTGIDFVGVVVDPVVMGGSTGGGVDSDDKRTDVVVEAICFELLSTSAHATNANCAVINNATTRRDDFTIGSGLQNLVGNRGRATQRVVIMIDDCITTLTKN